MWYSPVTTTRFNYMLSLIKTGRLFTLLFAVVLVSCRSEPSYNEIVKAELARTERFDSIAYGVGFGMTFADFKWVCLLQNRDGVFKPNATGNAVQLTFEEGFGYPALFEFFPADIKREYDTITKYNAVIKYREYSNFNKDMSMENLLREARDFFENGYGGRNFFKVPKKEDPWVKFNYVKVDGNRQIMLKPKYMGSELTVEFTDLGRSERPRSKPTSH